MGKLLALELFNFKSYKGHHVLHFGDSYFTSIIGPNGSGKSNSMDAISFVLGIKSSHLRSSHLRDLVYRGRVLKHSKIQADGTAVDDAPNGHANGDADAGASDDEDQAATQTSTQRNDPQTAWVMAVYEDDAGDEQRWKRSITSSGSSEYRINNRVVTNKQYNEALEAENILIKARNFLVFQGDVEAIASQSPKDLTKLIEQISGSLEYKAEYEQLKADKEKADEEQNYRLQQRRGINGEIKQFQEQKKELDTYENLRDEKDQAIVTHVLWKLFHFQRTIEDSTASIQKHQDELKEFRRNVQKFDKRLQEAKRVQAEVTNDMRKYEREIKKKEKDVSEKKTELIPIDEKLSLSSKNLEKYKKTMANTTIERDAQQEAANGFEKQLKKVQNAEKRWEDEWKAQQQQAGRELSDADLQEYQRLRGEVYSRSGSDQNKAENIKRQLKTDEETVKSLKSKLDNTQSQVTALGTEVSSLQERRSDINTTAKSTQSEIDAKKKAINALTSERERNRQKQTELDEKLRQVLMKLDEAAGMQRESQREANNRENVAQMKRIFPGVKGMFHQLCKPKQKKYETAISTALGRHWDSVIVDSDKTARQCIEYLKEQRSGQMTFVPMDTIIHSQANANLRGMHAGMRLAIDTIDYDANLERAMGFACGNAIVADTLQIARHLCYEKRVDAKAVTLDGTVIHKGGNMTGGEGLTERKRRFEEAEVENLRTLAQKFRADMEALPKGHKNQAEEEKLLSELSGLEAKVKYAQDELKALDRNIKSKNSELNFAQSQLKEVQPKYDEQAGGVATLRQQLEQHSGAIEEVEDNVFGTFCQRLGYNSIRDYEAQQGSQQEEANKRRVEYASQTSRLKNNLQFEQQRLQSTEGRIKRLQDQFNRDSQIVKQLESEKEDLGGQLDVLEAEIDQLTEQLAVVKEDSDAKGKQVSEARAELAKRSKNVEKTQAEISKCEAEAQQASTSRYTQLRQCKVENLEILLEEGSRKISALPDEHTVLQQANQEDEDAMDVDGEVVDSSLRAPSFNDYGIHPDFSDLDEDLQEDDSENCEASLVDKISSLTAKLEKMAPNMRSAERLEATADRLKATEREFTDSRNAAKEASAAFNAVKEKRMELFNKAFSHISDRIGPMYKDLTKDTSHNGIGGTATLHVEDDDEPYLAGVKYHAMPPLKRFRDMEHLSGGEKTMAALALLFAIHSFAPSPFFVLDEVDAALDNANTQQLARYVREHAGPNMQFVVISLKTGFFQMSETLVGVMRDQGANTSRGVTLDLRKYQAV